MMKFILLASAILALSAAQFQYRPTVTINRDNAGRYNPNSGRYNPSNSGRYVDNAGRYTPDNSGRYSGNDGRYVHDDSGRYGGGSGRYQHDESGKYNPDGSGAYSGQNGGYNHDGSGVYTGSNEKYQGDKYQGEKYQGDKYGANKGSASGSGSGFGSGAKRPVGTGNSGAGISAAAGFGAPVGLKQGSAAGKYENRNYAILRQEGNIDEDGYHYLYETENGITGEEQGKLANRGTDEEAMRASGFFTYTGPDNVEYTVRYTADENGFVPQADHLPTPPPVPEAILRALEYQRQQGTL